MAVFPEVCAMCDAAAAASRRFEDEAIGRIRGRLQLRIGFHFGPAVQANDDCFGTTVNMAARMVALAKGGQIITTGILADGLPPARRAATRVLVDVYAKGADDDTRVAELLRHLAENQTAVFSFLSVAELNRLPAATCASHRAARRASRGRPGRCPRARGGPDARPSPRRGRRASLSTAGRERINCARCPGSCGEDYRRTWRVA
ncbi:adenylate/guanylate cyclase domain-containing protein [Methylobacterium sp. ID0610]|uniref:adenylate/guanylate cyclase domain-containing protein n=1 Tax=Methylobacterium carpenticola TaxID=3344827 RepID=UPI00368CDA1B